MKQQLMELRLKLADLEMSRMLEVQQLKSQLKHANEEVSRLKTLEDQMKKISSLLLAQEGEEEKETQA